MPLITMGVQLNQVMLLFVLARVLLAWLLEALSQKMQQHADLLFVAIRNRLRGCFCIKGLGYFPRAKYLGEHCC